ncbi:hypothetical protein B0F90DRAFT_1623665 [Multifurca ochricompacta]|uniref:Uncharacterized protein n=1 Tax=Multifurca ochricompacta TaxID=376703 RepID=A0AAD4QSB6_9AGAM|nr:hypothetical protein B0F90DRAFT_1623665 [Multifurca ochricompacta]
MTSISTTPYTPRLSRTNSPPLSATSPSTVLGPQTQRLNIVTRLAIEGNAKKAESVPIKIYMKLTLPLDNIVPGTAISIFKGSYSQENVKILESEVHPLDPSSVPYNFSSASSPLLHNAARALNLPARSPHSYLTLFDQQPNLSSRLISSPSPSSDADVLPLEEKYTGHILVSGYQVSFVLPTELPPLFKLGSRLDNAGDYTPLPTKLRGRRGSISEKNALLFMAGISMMVPYLARPQRAPWLLSIPTPRCLSNTLKLRIFPPDSSTASSFQSLSSGEGDSDSPSWDMTADPHVTRTANPRRSTYQYQHFADDESSDSASAPGFSDGFGIQGTFPSTERIRVRWATPVRSIETDSRGGRRRVGVADVRGEMLCTILGRGRDRITAKEGVLVQLDYKGACQGVWYPGVATLLGMDVGLEARGCDVSWASENQSGWDVLGGPGYTGHEVVGAEHPPIERLDMPTMTIPSNLSTPMTLNGHTPSRQSSISSTSSLLRASLPLPNVPDYSFESAPTTPGSETGLSSVFYTTTDNDTREPTRTSSVAQSEPGMHLPSMPITLHLNINDLLPPNKNIFTFSIKGIVLVTPRSPLSPVAQDGSPHTSDVDNESHGLVISLPRFRVLAADNERLETTAYNNMDASAEALDVYSSSDPKARKAELARGSRTRVSSHGGRVALRLHPFSRALISSPLATRRDRRDDVNTPGRLTNHPRTPDLHRAVSSSALHKSLHAALKPIRDGPLMIPYVHATVTPLSPGGVSLPRAYAVCVRLPALADVENEWLDFGLGQVSSPQSTDKGLLGPVHVQIVSASLEGVPVKFETTAMAKTESAAGSALVFEQMSGKEWETWGRVHVGEPNGGSVEITYIVKQHNDSERKGKGKECAKTGSNIDVILPAFSIPVGRLQVDVEIPLGFEIASLQSNLGHQHISGDRHRLRQFDLGEFFYSQLRIHILPRRRSLGAPPWPPTPAFLRVSAYIAPTVFSIFLIILFLGLRNDLGRLRTSLERCGTPGSTRANVEPSVTVTATVLSRITGTSADAEWVSDSMPLASGAPTHLTPASVTMIDITSPSSIPHDRGRPPSGDTSAHGEYNALLPAQRLPLLWPIRFELPFTREQVLDTVNRGLTITWQILRRLYHYPLDPP